MRKIYSLDDRIRVKIDDLIIVVRPLGYEEKADIQASMVSGDLKAAMRGAIDTLKATLVSIEGLVDSNDEPYVYDPEKFDDVLNLPESPKMTKVALNLLSNIPEVFIDPESDNPLIGVEILKENDQGKK